MALAVAHSSIQDGRASILPGRITTATLTSFIRSVPSVDEVGVTERVGALATRSIKKDSKMAALLLAVRMMDLTTLEGKDTPGKIAQLSSKAIRPDPVDPDVPSVAAVCVYPAMVPFALQAVEGSGVKVAAVATYFPSGQLDTKFKMAETQSVVDIGADEVDMVIDRGAFLSGAYFKVFDEIRRTKEICSGRAHLKVILETGELGTLDAVRRASMLAMAAGADFIKTSTGKVQPAATLPVTLVMLEAIRDFYSATGVQIGMKPAGGIRTSKDAIRYLVVLNETLGSAWMTPDWFRFGASSLLNDVLMQIRWLKTGRYQSGDYFTKD
jgi:deoxyribose-phosphate aldolase